jgi:cytochrome c-type biogenesis protein CcsB
MKILMVSDYQLPVVACLFLFLAMSFYWISLVNPKNMFFFQLGKTFVLFGNILFALTLLLRWIGENYFPLSNLYESLIFLSWGISTIHLFIEFQTKSRLIGCIVSPILFFLSGFSSLTLPTDMQKALPLVPSLQSNWLMMHVTMMMISYATLIVGSLLSLLYLAFLAFNPGMNTDTTKKTADALNDVAKSKIDTDLQIQSLAFEENENLGQETHLSEKTTLPNAKHVLQIFNEHEQKGNVHQVNQGIETFEKEKQNEVLSKQIEEGLSGTEIKSSSKLALLQTIDLWSYRIIGLGFPFLTIGIISGAVWANEAWGSYWSWDPKETWALITWLVFAIYLHARLIKGWQGKQAATLGSCGFFVIWVCYLGVNFLGKGLHSYGWVF